MSIEQLNCDVAVKQKDDAIKQLRTVMDDMEKAYQRRIQDLLEANNRYLERARKAEAILQHLIEDQIPDEKFEDWQSWDLGCTAGDVREAARIIKGRVNGA